MGQTIFCYDCCWFAECYCVGISWSCCCFNCWVCQPAYLAMIRPQGCCISGGCGHGYGGTLCCCGEYWCAPEYLVNYSIRDHIGNKQPYLGDLQVTNSTQPRAGTARALNGAY